MVNVEIDSVQDVSMQSEKFDPVVLDPILRAIIIARTKDGATTDELLEDYKDLTGDCLLSIFGTREKIADYLRGMKNIWNSFLVPNGPFLWYCNTEKTQHLSNMIKNQKSPRQSNRKYQWRSQMPRTTYAAPSTSASASASSSSTMMPGSSGSGQRDKFFQDNINFVPKRNAWNRVQQQRTMAYHPYLPPQRRQAQPVMPMAQRRYYSSMNNVPNFCGYQMIGDDFFLSLARWELGYSFDPGHNIQQSGLCISGLTIAEAADRVMKATFLNDRVIVNIGVVDLLHGHDFVDMQMDLLQLMKNFENRGVYVILTTLSPLANSSHIPGVVDRLQKFNSLIRNQNWNYIDLWRCFVNERENTLYECFQPGPRHVSGSNQPHVLWNKLGRQRIIKFLKTHLGSFV